MAGLFSLLARWLGGAGVRRPGLRTPLTASLEISGYTSDLSITLFTADVSASGDVTGSVNG